MPGVRVAYVVREFPKLSETFVLREVTELVRRGEDVVVWSLRPGAGSELAGADEVRHVIRTVPGGPRGAWRLAGALARAAARRPRAFTSALAFACRWAAHDRDWRQLAAVPYAAYVAERTEADRHLHAHFANAPATVAVLAARLAGTRCSFTGHARDIFVATSPAFLRAKLRAATVMVHGTVFAARRTLERSARGLEHKVAVVPNGLHVSPPPTGPREQGLVVAVGRLVPKKGLDTLVRAVAVLRERGVDARCAIVGEGPERPRLEALASQLGVAPYVDLLGARQQPEIRRLLARATAFALPCRYDVAGDVDSMPLAILEAMELGAPVVTTPVGGIPEVVRDGESGLLVAPDDPPALADRLAALLADDGLRDRLAAGGRSTAEAIAVPRSVDRLLALWAAPPRPGELDARLAVINGKPLTGDTVTPTAAAAAPDAPPRRPPQDQGPPVQRTAEQG